MNRELTEQLKQNFSSGADTQQGFSDIAQQLQSGLMPQASVADAGQMPVLPQQNTLAGAAGQQSDIKAIAAKDIQIIQNLMRAGLINSLQGQNLMNHVLKRAYDMVQQQGMINQPQSQAVMSAAPQDAFSLFESENPDFFKTDGRNEVLNYLKNSKANVDKDEIAQISQLIQKLEECAVHRHLRKSAHEKSLNDENEAAKQKLRAYAQNSSYSDNKNRIFTREQIGNMSGAEFAKNEKAIMEQLRKGLIK